MTSLLVIVCTVLAVVSVANLALVLSVISRVRTLQEALEAGAGRFAEPVLPRAGTRIGRFETTTARGDVLTDRSLAARTTLVGFFTANCNPCDKVKAELLQQPPTLPMIAFVDGSPTSSDTLELGRVLGQIAEVVYASAEDAVNEAFRPAGYPTLLRVERGTVAAAGHRLSDVLA